MCSTMSDGRRIRFRGTMGVFRGWCWKKSFFLTAKFSEWVGENTKITLVVGEWSKCITKKRSSFMFVQFNPVLKTRGNRKSNKCSHQQCSNWGVTQRNGGLLLYFSSFCARLIIIWTETWSRFKNGKFYNASNQFDNRYFTFFSVPSIDIE